MLKSRIIQASAEFFNEGIVNNASASLSTGCFGFAQHRLLRLRSAQVASASLSTGIEAEKFEHACSMKAIGNRSRKFVNNAG